MIAAVYILLCLIWGTTWLAIKIGLEDAPPFTSAAIRFLLATSIMYAIAFSRRAKFPRAPRELFRRAHPGLYLYGCSYGLIYSAEQYISSALTSVLFASFPFYVALLSKKMLKAETPGVTAWIGLSLGFAGIVIISWESLGLSDELFMGSLLALAGSFLSALAMIMHKRDLINTELYSTAALQMTLGTVILLMAALLFEDLGNFVISPVSVGSILYLTIFGTVVAFSGFYWLLKRTTVVIVSLIAFITPVVAIFVGVGLFDEPFTVITVIGTALILSGVFLVARKRKVA